MFNMIKDIFNFISTLTLVDFILYFAVIVLIVLVVSLIYIVKTESEDIELKEVNEDNDDLDLVALSKEIDEHEPYNVDLTDYETEQEEKAIISYDELIKQRKNYEINYKEENIKKIDTDNIITELEDKIEEKQNPPVNNVVISYEKEEAFLKALQQLNEILN